MITKQDSPVKFSKLFRLIKLLILFGLCIHAGTGKSQNKLFIDARPVTQIPVAVYECSGIAVMSPNRIWAQNDAGNTNELFCFDTTGNLVRSLLILNATNIDWEDLTRDDEGRIYINDAGNNDNSRTDLKIHRIPDPETIVGSVVEAETVNFIFEDQYQFPPPSTNLNYDIEAIAWKSDSLYLFTKNRSNPQNGMCKMYRLPAAPGTYTAKLMGSIFLGENNDEARVTSADINPESGEVILLTMKKIISFTNYPFNNFFDGDKVEYFFSTPMGQIEGVDFVDTCRLFLTEEGSKRAGGYLYEVLWQSTSAVRESILERISVFPNPFHDFLMIDNPTGLNITADMWDIHGKMVKRNANTDRVIRTQDLNPGVYFLELKMKDQFLVKQVVKH